MKKKAIKIMAAQLCILGLFATPAHAGTWIQHEGYDLSLTDGIYKGAWEYQLDDSKYAIGWHYIDNNWYYFYPEDGCAATGLVTIGNDRYYFDTTSCKLQTNTWVPLPNSSLMSWADENGRVSYCLIK